MTLSMYKCISKTCTKTTKPIICLNSLQTRDIDVVYRRSIEIYVYHDMVKIRLEVLSKIGSEVKINDFKNIMLSIHIGLAL